MSIDERRELATELLLVAAIKKRLTDYDNELRDRAKKVFDRPGVRDIGMVGDGDDDQIGSVARKAPAVTWVVVDEPAFREWVRATHPDEIQVKETVADTYVTAVKLRCKELGAAVTKDGEPIPGLEQVVRSANLDVTPARDAAATIARAVAEGRFSLDRLPLAAIEQVQP